MIPVLSPMNSSDQNVPFLFDFSNLLAAGDTIAGVNSISTVPTGITIGASSIAAGARANCAVTFTLGSGTSGTTYTVTADITTAEGVQLARSAFVTVGGV